MNRFLLCSAGGIARFVVFFIFLSASILVHELGHMLVAERNGVVTGPIQLGFGPRVLESEWWGKPLHLHLFPLGGEVAVLQGVDPEKAPIELLSKYHYDREAMRRGPEWQSVENRTLSGQSLLVRLATMLAGPAGSLVAGIVFLFLYSSGTPLKRIKSGITGFCRAVLQILCAFGILKSDEENEVAFCGPIGFLAAVLRPLPVHAQLEQLAYLNIGWGLFNLLPIPPMDGFWALAEIVVALLNLDREIVISAASSMGNVPFFALFAALIVVEIYCSVRSRKGEVS
ncbi:MAG: site-2 protease family protein [Deltaproteobacteria bacterium]|nr:site-2 protease family protein [Deltaproteobacteria bacterium]